MASTTTSSAKRRSAARHPATGFTLVEVMMCAAIGSFVMLGILTTYGMIVRSGTGLYNYVGMELEARRGLEKFSEDTRMASAIDTTMISPAAWPNIVKLTIPHVNSDTFSNTIYYWWDNSSGSSTYHNFRRREIDTDSSGTQTSDTTTEVIHDVSSFQFDRWQAGGATGVQATSDANTDQLQIHLTLRKQSSQYGVSGTAIVAATNLVVSARYILRNKL